ncbi:hypothetical protein [Mucilaginibacter panaciglaebae]|uniref:DUF3945 domain-containing protein n=1 Tax=Mucilaginibacter panaciglaebae TaxID=502331 RepID=A0ABP7WLK7_9SPHI
MRLETKYAEKIISLLEDAQDVGMPHVVFELRPQDMELQPHQLSLFEKLGEALEYLDNAAGNNYLPGDADYPIYYRHVDQLLEEIKQANSLTINKIDMNRNNLENIQNEMKDLRFSKKAIEEAQQKMEKGLPEFTVADQLKGNKGQVDVTAHFRQSGQSDNYYLNKFAVALNTGKALEEGHKYFIITRNEKEPGKNLTKSFENVSDAISFFKDQKGDSRLAAGKDAAHATELAEMKAGKVEYVEKDFQRTFRTPAQTQTFFVERGRGFTVDQAANLIQGRSVYRDDLLNLGGQPYAAWIKLDMDSPKDRYQNYQTNQYHVPSYGFTTKEALEKYHIKELGDPKKLESLMASIENGNRPLVTTVKDGEEIKLHIEAAPRFRQINFFQENGKPEKREQFLKEPKLEQTLQVNKGKEKEQEQGMAV